MKKEFGIKRLFKSFKYSLEGLIYAFTHEQNMVVHIMATLLIMLVSYLLELSLVEWIIVIILIGLVLATELINTSIEALVDLVCREENSLAKVAKDTAAAAVFIFALTAVIAGLAIYIPALLKFI